MMATEFFMPMEPPTCTHQEKRVHVGKDKKPVFYEPQELRNARAKLEAHLARHKPDERYGGAVELVATWCFPRGKHKDGEYRTSRPDTSTLQSRFQSASVMSAPKYFLYSPQQSANNLEVYGLWEKYRREKFAKELVLDVVDEIGKMQGYKEARRKGNGR